MAKLEGFIVHNWTEFRTGRIFLSGRAVDGRSFAVAIDDFIPALYIPAGRLEQAISLTIQAGIAVGHEDVDLIFPLGGHCAVLRVADSRRKELADMLNGHGIAVHGQADKPSVQFLAERGVRAGISLEGETRAGRRVDLVFHNPVAGPSIPGEQAPLRWLSLDIETTRAGEVSACALVMDDKRIVFVVVPELVSPQNVAGAVALGSEHEVLKAMRDQIVAWDPDVITGWNVVDFDLKVIAERSQAHGFFFDAGRSDAPLRILESPGQRTLCILEGRRCIDAMKVLRSGPERFEDQRLETVARGVLGEGKLLAAQGPEKLDELEALRLEDPAAYAAYCLRDAELPLAILEKTGLGKLTVLRSVLTGLDLERAWTSVPAFEQVYGFALRKRGILPVAPANPRVGGAAGGLILAPRPGLFDGVIVFDFRSLYPSIIRTFNIDPVALLRASGGDDDLVAPNGARFSPERGVLPEVVDEWTALRTAAIKAGDAPRAYVLKILQNAFYGVLGSPGCAWADDRLAGAITGYGHEILRATRDWFTQAGYEVLYGDTDSVFIRAGAQAIPSYQAGKALAESLARAACESLALLVESRWQVESRLELRFDKLYRRFMIPRIRGDRTSRIREELDRLGTDNFPTSLLAGLPGPKGRAKGYAGLLLNSDGSTQVDIKGLEAARGDWTALARRFQTELFEMVFTGAGEHVSYPKHASGLEHVSGPEPANEGTVSGGGEAFARDYARKLVAELRAGRLDHELAFQRVLKRDLDRYTADAPHVKAARLAGVAYRGQRVAYAQTTNGPEPLGAFSGPLDYSWYLERQLGPIWESIAEAAGWEPQLARIAGEQLELF
jgi:DNA polymerase II